MTLIALAAAIFGGLSSALFEFFPKLSDWFHALTANGRRVVILTGNGVIAVVVGLLLCNGLVSLPVQMGDVCDPSSWQLAVNVLWALLFAEGGSVIMHNRVKAEAV